MRWPAKLKARESGALASSLDIAPTLLRAAGAEPVKEMRGLNLMDEAAMTARETLFGECFTHNAVDLDVPAKSLRWRWCIQKNLKLIVPGPAESGAPVELYDLNADAKEQRNLAEERAGEVARLRAALDGWWKGEP